MKKMIIAILATLAMTSAHADWVCHAKSPSGSWGKGVAWNKGDAEFIAMDQCKWNTPRWSYCYISNCYWR